MIIFIMHGMLFAFPIFWHRERLSRPQFPEGHGAGGGYV